MIPKQLEGIPDIKAYTPSNKEWGYIYFIIFKGEVIYIGQTKSDITSRLMEFKRWKKNTYDSIYYILRHANDLDGTELYYINKFKPEYNRRGKTSTEDKPSNS